MLTFFQADRWRSESDDGCDTSFNHHSDLRSPISNLSNMSGSETPRPQEQFSSSPTHSVHRDVPPPLREGTQQAQHTSHVNDEAAEHNTYVDDDYDVSSFKTGNCGANKKTHGVSAIHESSSDSH